MRLGEEIQHVCSAFSRLIPFGVAHLQVYKVPPPYRTSQAREAFSSALNVELEKQQDVHVAAGPNSILYFTLALLVINYR